jgi:hypothetical protein
LSRAVREQLALQRRQHWNPVLAGVGLRGGDPPLTRAELPLDVDPVGCEIGVSPSEPERFGDRTRRVRARRMNGPKRVRKRREEQGHFVAGQVARLRLALAARPFAPREVTRGISIE